MGKTVEAAKQVRTARDRVAAVRDAVDDNSAGLEPVEEKAFLEEMLAEAEGWKMRLEELNDDLGDGSDVELAATGYPMAPGDGSGEGDD